MSKPKEKEVIYVEVDSEVKEKLRQLAERDRRNMSNFLIVLIEKAWEQAFQPQNA
jgi:predicted transcriptional regulator